MDVRLPHMPEEEPLPEVPQDAEELALRPELEPPAQLVDALCLHSSDGLNALARKLGLATRHGRKAVVAGAIACAVTYDLPQVLERLSEEERAILQEAAAAGGELSPPQFAAKHETNWPTMDRGYGYGRAVSHLTAFGYMNEEGLYELAPGLVEPLRQLLGTPPPLALTVLEQVPTEIDLPRRWEGMSAERRPVRVSAGEPRALTEARRVLTLAQAGKLAVTDSQRRPTEATVRRVAEVLAEPDFEVEEAARMGEQWYQAAGPIRAHAWPVLAQQCGWCRPKAGKLALTPAGREFLASGSAEQYREAVDQLTLDDSFDELNRVSTIRGQSGAGKRYATEPSWRRTLLMGAMGLWPVGAWVPFTEALRLAYATEGHVSVHDDPIRLYFAERQYGHLACYARDLTAVYLRALLFESLGTLGLVDVAYVHPHRVWPEFAGTWGTDDLVFCSRYDGLLFVRLNALGAYCLGRAEAYEAPRPEAQALFSVLPNFEVAVLADTGEAAAALHVLEQWAVKTADRSWRLDRRRILDALETGGSIAELRSFLEAHATDGVPHTVEVLLADIEAKASAVRGVEEAFIIDLGTEEDAAVVGGHAETRRYCRRLGERSLVVKAREMARFRAAAKKAGYALPPAAVGRDRLK